MNFPFRGARWALCLASVSTSALAADSELESDVRNPDTFELPVQTLFFEDVPQIQKPGEFQSIVRGRFYRTDDGPEFQAPLSVEAGLVKRLELEATVPVESQQTAQGVTRGVSNVEVGGNYELLSSAEQGFVVATGLTVILPAPTSQLAQESYGLRANLNAFRQFGALGLNALVGPKVVREQDGDVAPRAELGLGATLGRGTVVPVAEVRSALGEEQDLEATAGVQLEPLKTLQLGLGVLGGWLESEPVYGVATTLSWQIGQ